MKSVVHSFPNRTVAGVLAAVALGAAAIPASWTTVEARTPILPLVETSSTSTESLALSPEHQASPFRDGGHIEVVHLGSQSRGGGGGDNDTSHYARGSVFIQTILVDHAGGQWEQDEIRAQRDKLHAAQDYFKQYAPENALRFRLGEDGFAFAHYNPELPYDVSDWGSFQGWMAQDAAAQIGFTDDDGDGDIIDDLAIEVQNYFGNSDNVIVMFIPADVSFNSIQVGGPSSWSILSHDMHHSVWAYLIGRHFGGCAEGGTTSGCENILCDDICQSEYLVDEVPNGNCQSCADSDECLMRGGWVGGPPCEYTRRNWGWADMDGNDVVDNTIAREPGSNSEYEVHELSRHDAFTDANGSLGWAANHYAETWAVMGVRSRDNADWNMSVFGDNNNNYLLAESAIGTGTQFVVADFHHSTLGRDYIRLSNSGGAGFYDLGYATNVQTIYANGETYNDHFGVNEVVQAFNVPLFAGETIRIELDVDDPDLDLGMALFSSEGSQYYAPRSQSMVEADAWPGGLDEVMEFVVPEDDVYGLVVFANNVESGPYSIKIGPTPLELIDDESFSSVLDLRLYHYTPQTPTWSIVGVRPDGGTDVSLGVFYDLTYDWELTRSDQYAGVEFVAVDYRWSQEANAVRVPRISGAGAHTTEWEQGSEILSGWYSETWENGDVAKIWDAYLNEGTTYRFQYYGSVGPDPDMKLALANSHGLWPYQRRANMEVEASGNAWSTWFEFTPEESLWYGAVLAAEEEVTTDYFLGMGPSIELMDEQPVTLPDEIIFSELLTEEDSWAVVGILPKGDAESAFGLWSCENEDISCFLGLDGASEMPYMVIDGNHAPAQSYYSRTDRTSGTVSRALTFDIASEDIEFNDLGDVVVHQREFAGNEAVQIWDLNVGLAATPVRVTVRPLSPNLDVDVRIHSSREGDYYQASGDYVAASQSFGEGEAESAVFVSVHPDVYGLTVSNASATPGLYEVIISESSAADAPDGPVLDTPTALDLRVTGGVSDHREFELSLPGAAAVKLEVFDVAGRHVRTLNDGSLDAGIHSISWDGRDENGSNAGSGVFFAKLRAGTDERTVKVVQTR